MKTISLWAFVIVASMAAFWLMAGCETNHPQEAPELTEVDASVIAGPGGGTYDGWWVVICPKKTDATSFRISAGPDDHNITQKIIWRQGDPLEFQLLGGHDYNQIFVCGYSGQDGKTAYFGVCHDTQICARRFQPNQTETSGGEGHLVRSSDTDIWDCQ
jgi:hypothetical protein